MQKTETINRDDPEAGESVQGERGASQSRTISGP